MAIVNRNTLKNFFKKGGFAKENHFVDLIDSTINSVDDGIQINKNDGLRLNRSSFSSKLISFFKKPNQENPLVSFNMDKDDLGGFSVNGKDGKTILRFDENGKIGLNKSRPENDVDIEGTLGIQSRVGSYLSGIAEGDGNWHDILTGLDGLNSFEINASIKGKSGSGRYCVLNAVALSTFGGSSSKSKIRQTTAYYGFFLNKIALRWAGEIHNYKLQIRTRRHYGIDPNDGEPFKIKYNLTKLIS